MISTHVIILAQGNQQRMGHAISIPKQLLKLPACGDTPIIGRTVRQLLNTLEGANANVKHEITLVGWYEIAKALGVPSEISLGPFLPEISWVSLPDPGNSSLKGIHRYLEGRQLALGQRRFDRTIVLLGDVVYSWKCLEALVDKGWGNFAEPYRIRFVGTSDISPSGGELWGVAWTRAADAEIAAALEHALEKHPPYETYQPGQLRRWMWAIHPSFQSTDRYVAIDDYTMDIDLPEHLEKLTHLSRAAADDDLAHGVEW